MDPHEDLIRVTSTKTESKRHPKLTPYAFFTFAIYTDYKTKKPTRWYVADSVRTDGGGYKVEGRGTVFFGVQVSSGAELILKVNAGDLVCFCMTKPSYGP